MIQASRELHENLFDHLVTLIIDSITTDGDNYNKKLLFIKNTRMVIGERNIGAWIALEASKGQGLRRKIMTDALETAKQHRKLAEEADECRLSIEVLKKRTAFFIFPVCDICAVCSLWS